MSVAEDTEGCVFCDIVAGRAPSKGVYEWNDCVAFVPLNPVTEGHVLVVPRVHVAHALENHRITSQVFRRAAEWAALHEAVNLITSVGSAASQTVFHLHVHVVPRRPGDGLHLPWTGQESTT